MSSIRELREQLQAPRKAVDTWYGRQVMRRFSIYLTWLFLPLRITPNQVTLVSLMAGLLSAWIFAFDKKLGGGIGLLNVWYLLDHVDGEIARYTGKASATGFYFDTIVNFMIQPLTFLALGICLDKPHWGITGAYGFLMLMILPMCEDVIRYSLLKKEGTRHPSEANPAKSKISPSFPKTIFMAWHKLLNFPDFLLVISSSYLVCKGFSIAMAGVFNLLLIFYALSANLIWILQLTQKVMTRKLDTTASG
ncbi:MAG: CDP-alcohol phosphatidyltransferase family protein [Candidatus Omnitrophica bacterium]|nr:CDP-alcohol phosphatidyltransferase family protein [Candidatus Omnitrophota bacterium]